MPGHASPDADDPADPPPSHPSRRTLLRVGAYGGGTAALLAAIGAGATTALGAPSGAAAATATAASTTPSAMENLFTYSDLDFETLFSFGSIAYGCAEFGELVTAVDHINNAGASYQTYYDTFLALAQRTEALADQELAAGHISTARGAYLRASTYYDMCLYFILGTSAHAREADSYADVQRCWQQASRLFETPFEQVRIPYEGTYLPGYLLRPDDRPVRRPTVILNNGEDAQNITLYALGGADAIARGYNALIFEGPGQGSLLFERQIPFRHDWENVITPVVDYLRSRPDVDPSRIVLNGSSMGGMLVVRAAAFEHRLAAVVADPAILGIWLSWQTGYPSLTGLFAGGAGKEQVNTVWQKDVIPTLTAGERYNFAKRAEGYGRQFLLAGRAGQVFTDFYDFGTTVMKFTVDPVADQVTTPTLLTAYQNDALILPSSGPDQQGRQVDNLMRGDRRFHEFTDAARFHCAPMAPQVRNQVVYDWLDTTI